MLARLLLLMLCACVRAPTLSTTAVSSVPPHWEAENEQWMDDGGLVDVGDPELLPADWRPDLSVPAHRQRAETAPGHGPWTACLDPGPLAGLTWDQACERVVGGISEPDLSRRRAIEFASSDCSGPQRSFPDARPSPHRVPEGLTGGLILRCAIVNGIADSGE